MSAEQAGVDLNEATIEAALLQIRGFSGYAATKTALSGIKITPAQLAAGRAAFKRKRRQLDDLWQAFDCDIDAAVRHIYREMVRAGL